MKCETDWSNLFFLWFFNDYSMTYANIGGIRDPFKVDQALEFYRDENKDFSILTESHINHDQMHHINKNWLNHILFSTGDSETAILACPVFYFLLFFYKMIYRMNENQKQNTFNYALIDILLPKRETEKL